MTDLTPFQMLVYEAVEKITEKKKDTVIPCVAHIFEIRSSVNVDPVEALRELYRKCIVSVKFDKNKNPMFQIKNPIKS